jgi:hypothetical protein
MGDRTRVACHLCGRSAVTPNDWVGARKFRDPKEPSGNWELVRSTPTGSDSC